MEHEGVREDRVTNELEAPEAKAKGKAARRKAGSESARFAFGRKRTKVQWVVVCCPVRPKILWPSC